MMEIPSAVSRDYRSGWGETIQGSRRECFLGGEGTVLFLDYGVGYITAIVKIYITVHLKIRMLLYRSYTSIYLALKLNSLKSKYINKRLCVRTIMDKVLYV